MSFSKMWKQLTSMTDWAQWSIP